MAVNTRKASYEKGYCVLWWIQEATCCLPIHPEDDGIRFLQSIGIYLPPTSPLKPIVMWFEVSIAVLWYVASNISEGYTAYIFRVESEDYSHNWEDHNVNITVIPVCLSWKRTIPDIWCHRYTCKTQALFSIQEEEICIVSSSWWWA